MRVVSSIRPMDRAETSAPQTCLDAGLESLADFAASVRGLEAELEALHRVAGASARHSVEQLQEELRAFEPSITILGQVKSGKTTLVNSLAGWSDLLPSDVNPWTSVVTSLHLVPGLNRRDVGAKFQLVTEEDWDRLLTKGGRLGELAQRADAAGEMEKIRQQIEMMREKSRARLGKKFELMLGQLHEYGYFDRNLLERYICLGDDFLAENATEDVGKQGWFADITRSADLYLRCQTVPIPICMRDTPGVNDTFLMREQVTINAVRDSKICVVVLSAHQALTTVDLGLIRMISNLRSRNVIIFVNRIDELKSPATEVVEIEDSIRATLRTHGGPADCEIIFGSAYWANKVLSETITEIGTSSSDALVNWAEASIRDSDLDLPPADLVWQLSGLPDLNRSIAGQIVASLGTPLLRKVASGALTIASSLKAAELVRVEGVASERTHSMASASQDLQTLAERHMNGLSKSLAELTEAFQQRSDRSHASFLERATHSLIRHLEEYGEDLVWDYNPSGLRVLLKSAYLAYTAKAREVAAAQYRAAVQDVAELLYTAFGNAVEGIELAVPELPDAPAPVTLAQTIVLDFNDGWWVSWWRRARGYKAFSERFRGMIAAETKDYMTQFKTAPAAEMTAQIELVLQKFLDQCRDILFEIGSGDRQALHRVVPGSDRRDQRKLIEGLVSDLRQRVEDASTEGEEI